MASGFDEFGGSLTAKVEYLNMAAIPKPNQLHVFLDSGTDFLREQFPGIETVVLHKGGVERSYSFEDVIAALDAFAAKGVA